MSVLHLVLRNKKDNINTDILLCYLLTCDQHPDVDDIIGFPPMYMAVQERAIGAAKLFVDFGGDHMMMTAPNKELFTDISHFIGKPKTPLIRAKNSEDEAIFKMLTECYPSEMEKLMSQLECKRKVDSIFEKMGRPRFKQAEIDVKYQSLSQSIDAVMSGNLDLLQESIPHVNAHMAVSLAIVAVEHDRSHLLNCLFERIPQGEWLFGLRNNKSIEPLLYFNLDATVYSKFDQKPSSEVVECANRSRVLCLFKILYHKYIFLNIQSIFDLVQTLMFEELYVENERLDSEREQELRSRSQPFEEIEREQREQREQQMKKQRDEIIKKKNDERKS